MNDNTTKQAIHEVKPDQGYELRYETPKGFATPHFRASERDRLMQALQRLAKRHIEATVLDMQTWEEVGGVTFMEHEQKWNWYLWTGNN